MCTYFVFIHTYHKMVSKLCHLSEGYFPCEKKKVEDDITHKLHNKCCST